MTATRPAPGHPSSEWALKRRAEANVSSTDKLLQDLNAARIAAGIIVPVLADRMGITLGAAVKLTRYDADPTLSVLRRYAVAVGAVIEHTVDTSAISTDQKAA
jgi:hypothetical protein